MATNRSHWLEIAEYVAYSLTVLSLIQAIATKALITPLIGLSLTLGLNLINRLRWQYIQRKRLAALLKQSHRQDLSPPTPNTHLSALTVIQENLSTLENSLNGMVKYLNDNALKERVEQLEKAVTQQKLEIFPSYHSRGEALTPASDPLPAVNLTPIPPAIPLGNWQCIHSLTAHSQAIGAISISLDQRFLASASWDKTLKIWDLPEGQLLASVKAHDQGILALIFLGDEKYQLASGGFDQVIKIWSFLPDGEQLKLSQVLKAHTGSIHGLGYMASSSLLVSGSYDRSVQQWDLERQKVIANSSDELGAIYAIAVHPSHQWIASGGGDGTVSLWQSQTGSQRGTLSGNVSSVASMAISPDGQTLAVGCVDGSIKLWHLDLKHPKPIRAFIAHQGQVNALQFSQDSQLLFSGGADGQINIWYPKCTTAIATLPLVDDSTVAITSLQLSRDNQYLVAGGMDGSLKIWAKV